MAQNKNEQDQASIFRLQYQNKANGNQGDQKTIEFSATQAEYDFLFNQMKEVFKLNKEKILSLDNRVKVALRLITYTDLEFVILKMVSYKGHFLPLLQVYIFCLEKHGINKPGASILNINRQYLSNICMILRAFFLP